MNKKLIAFTLICLAVLSTLTACKSNNTNDTTKATDADKASSATSVTFATVDEVPATITNADAQYQLIAEKVSTSKLKEFDTTDEPETFKYAVTDLDNDGKLEIFSATCASSNRATSTILCEVNDDCSDLIIRHETDKYSEDAEADFIVDSTDCFINPETMERFFICQNSLAYSGDEILLTKGYFTLLDEYLDKRTLANKTYQSNGVIFDDFDDNVLTEEEFNNITDVSFAGYAKLTATFGWIDFRGVDDSAAIDLTTDALVDNLKASFEKFSVK